MDKTEDLVLEDKIMYRQNKFKFNSVQMGKIKMNNPKDTKMSSKQLDVSIHSLSLAVK
uniref:Uncharacterized protein n=1 Tax=Solanum tuberosum TaxID=4113 RepID=M1CXK1_SOLTU